MLTSFRLVWRLNRIELTLLGIAALVLIVGALWFGWRINELLAAHAGCFGVTLDDTTTACNAVQRTFSQQILFASLIGWGVVAAPFVLGLFLGVAPVASEIEHGTATIAWSLSPTKRRWLVRRVMPVTLLVLAALLMIGWSTEWLQQAVASVSTGEVAFRRSFQPWSLLVARGTLSLAIGLCVGALVGRSLPALLASAVTCLVIFLAVNAVMESWMRAEAVPIAVSDEPSSIGASNIFDMAYRNNATGELINMNDYFGVVEGQAVMGADDVPGMTIVALRVPASLYSEFVLRESGLLATATLLIGGLAVAVVRRRRPY